MSDFVKRTFPIFQCISSLNIIYARIHNICTIEIREPDFNGDSQAKNCVSSSKDENRTLNLKIQQF